MKKWKYLVIIINCCLFSFVANAQLSVQGLLHVQDGAELHVWNDVEILSADGVIENAGTIEVEGNWTKDDDGQFDNDPLGMGPRLVVFRNNNFNTTGSQTISGTMNLVNAFFNLEIDNTGAERLVDLGNTVEVAGNLNFINGRIRTDVMSNTAGNGNAYANILFVSNTDNNAITGHTTVAATDRYVEGKLIRLVDGMGTYDFPVGIGPDLLDGAEPLSVTFSAPTSNSNILAAFQIQTTTPVGETRLCDIGTAPDFDTPDGTLDQLEVDCVMGQWVMDGDAASYNFDIEFMPGSELLNSCPDATLFYVANNGEFDDCPDFSGSTGIVGMGQTDFGTFDIPTVTEASITTSLEVISKDDNRIGIFPNPLSTQEKLNINIEGAIFEGEQITLEILDAMGRIVYRDHNVTTNGLLEVDVNNLNVGIYQLVLKNSKVIANRSFVIQL